MLPKEHDWPDWPDDELLPEEDIELLEEILLIEKMECEVCGEIFDYPEELEFHDCRPADRRWGGEWR